MNVIFIPRRDGRARQINLARPLTLGVMVTTIVAVLGGAFAFGLSLGRGVHRELALAETTHLGQVLSQQKQQTSGSSCSCVSMPWRCASAK